MKKLLIWDGDETLWNGTLLEGDRPELPHGRWALCAQLAERGVLQSLASHNRPADALAALHALDLDRFFLAPQADLADPKPAMISRIFTDLGLASERDAVFVDDNPTHRSEVQVAWPQLLVVPPHELDDVIATQFSKPTYTDDDRLRVRRYKDEVARTEAAASYNGDRLDFLRSLGIQMHVGRPQAEDWPRIVDLVTRSHRFSALARDMDERHIRDFGQRLWVARVADRFGDYGLSAVIADVKCWIPLLVVSCRLAGKGIGSALVAHVVNSRPDCEHGVSWVGTEYNTSLSELFEWHGFQMRVRQGNHFRGRRPWTGPAQSPDWIQVLT